jgi:hypothetical protein
MQPQEQGESNRSALHQHLILFWDPPQQHAQQDREMSNKKQLQLLFWMRTKKRARTTRTWSVLPVLHNVHHCGFYHSCIPVHCDDDEDNNSAVANAAVDSAAVVADAVGFGLQVHRAVTQANNKRHLLLWYT